MTRTHYLPVTAMAPASTAGRVMVKLDDGREMGVVTHHLIPADRLVKLDDPLLAEAVVSAQLLGQAKDEAAEAQAKFDALVADLRKWAEERHAGGWPTAADEVDAIVAKHKPKPSKAERLRDLVVCMTTDAAARKLLAVAAEMEAEDEA